jgi:hypothetical protein
MRWSDCSTVGLPEQGVAIDTVAVGDAATHDGQTLSVMWRKSLASSPT